MKKQFITLYILVIMIIIACGGGGDSIVKDFVKGNNDFASAVDSANSPEEIVTAIKAYKESATAFFEKVAESPELTSVSTELQEEMVESQTKATEAFMKITEYMDNEEVMEAFTDLSDAMGSY